MHSNRRWAYLKRRVSDDQEDGTASCRLMGIATTLTESTTPTDEPVGEYEDRHYKLRSFRSYVTVEKKNRRSEPGCMWPYGQGSLTEPSFYLKPQRSCEVCFDLDLPDEHSRNEWNAYFMMLPPSSESARYRLDLQLDELEDSAEAGCPTCRLLRDIRVRLGLLPRGENPGTGPEFLEFERFNFDIRSRRDRDSQSQIIIIHLPTGFEEKDMEICIHRELGK